ncbi:MAG: isoprenyl transferase [Limnochordia bacterium]
MPKVRSRQEKQIRNNGSAIDMARIPKHIAIIMDGNGRWAKKRGLPRVTGHRAGVSSLKECVRQCSDLQVEVLTVYAFSTENWGRPVSEVKYLLSLLEEVFEREVRELHENNVRVKVIGKRENLPASTLLRITEAEALTAQNTGLVLNICFNYGGRAEIVEACKALGREVKAGVLEPDGITEAMLSDHLLLKDCADPDLLIRTGGEMRVSNFLLWQIAYAEIFVLDVFWPDFRPEHLYKAIADYQGRQRRFGKV